MKETKTVCCEGGFYEAYETIEDAMIAFKKTYEGNITENTPVSVGIWEDEGKKWYSISSMPNAFTSTTWYFVPTVDFWYEEDWIFNLDGSLKNEPEEN